MHLRLQALGTPKSDGSSSENERSIHSSMSDSEREKIERDNRRVRMRRVKKRKKSVHKEKDNSIYPTKRYRDESNPEQKNLANDPRGSKEARRLREQMQKTLEKTAAQLKAEERQKLREQSEDRKVGQWVNGSERLYFLVAEARGRVI